jgi:succinoglycan biosynthesis protein ExoO
MARRRASLQRALAFDDLVSAVKQRHWGEVIGSVLWRPRVAALLRRPVIDRLHRFAVHRAAAPDNARQQICVLSRQRIIGNTNGSSVYLLSLCNALQQSGADVHLLCPSPAVFGRWPAMLLRPEMRIFRSIRLRRSLHAGRVVLATDPATVCRAIIGVIGKLGARLGIASLARLDRAAAYAISQPWTRQDILFVARHARQHADVIVADYAFLTDGIPYTLRPDARSLVVMHDLFSSRAGQFDRLGGSDSVAGIEQAAEMALLHKADAVIAIQPEEALVVQCGLPDQRVIVAPIAVTTVDEPQPGQAGIMLFVGSSTAPNVLGLHWFVETILPRVLVVMPEASLWVAGTVCGKFATAPAGVRLLGPVRDLAAVYRQAAVVVSPLQVGSGLKIKLIEALGHGKAVVATSVTMQGVGGLLADAVAVADEPAPFAAAVIELLADPALRRMRAAEALSMARRHFSATACHAELVAFVTGSSETAGNAAGSPIVTQDRGLMMPVGALALPAASPPG